MTSPVALFTAGYVPIQGAGRNAVLGRFARTLQNRSGGHVIMATLDSLHALLEEELKDIYDAEKQLTKALPKLAKKASSRDLKAGFEAHLQQTEEQIDRLEQV